MAVATPPIHMVTPETAQLIATCGIGAACLALFIWMLVRWRRTGDPTGVLVMIGGLVCALCEPIVDILGLCYFPRRGGWIVFTTFGRPMPLWLVLAYVLYFGGLVYLASRFLLTSPTRGQVWLGIVGLFVVNLGLELPTLAAHVYTYYGQQPFRIARHPIAWLVINCQGALLAAVILARFGGFFTGPRRLALVLLPASCYFCSWVIAMPHFMTINSGAPFWVKWVGSAVTMAVGLVFIDYLIRVGIAGPGVGLGTGSTRVAALGPAATSREPDVERPRRDPAAV